ncbi:MAG TPA: 4-hydroxybenzoate octaprenyltransferase [Planctomycetes bacterium]|nr:4-hydroxybenzoate octaprenyltransferase [Planctomycetota bacterium]
MRSLMAKPTVFFRLIRFEHTLFALPWALTGALVAARGLPEARVFLWILVAMVGARTAAMSFNRLVDRRFDAANPRTASRPSVTGDIGVGFMAGAVLLSAGLFFWAAWNLNPLAFALAGPTLAVLLGYSLVKRFWAGSHFVLGVALGLSPLGAWVAVRGTLEGAWPALALGLAVVAWTTGFDILYACQDEAVDRRLRLHSVPARCGISGALWWARISHLFVVPSLLLAGWTANMGYVFFGAAALVAALLIWEHRLVHSDDLSQVNRAFFQVNVVIAFVVLLGASLDFWLTAGGAM